MSDCVRSITFLIPGKNGAPGVQVYAEEIAGGDLKIVLDVLQVSNGSTIPGDMRGLFFDLTAAAKVAGKLVGLIPTGSPHIHSHDTVNVIDLGNGVNMNGSGPAFDFGVRFGHAGNSPSLTHVEFTLQSSGNLTLDDIAHVRFGARPTNTSSKSTIVSPAAPDAKDDVANIYEDGQSGLTDPSHTPEGTLIQVLANDTDLDGNELSITEVHEFTAGGHAVLVDGADADTLEDDAIMYFPAADYSGVEKFEYCVTDNHGGTDFAEVTVNITAVADVPDVTYEVIAGTTVNEFTIRVTADQTDADSSEFIDRIDTSALPAGVTLVPTSVNPGTEPDQIVQDFLITLPLDVDTKFNLTFTATSKETSNGDTETGSVVVPIEMQANTIVEDVEYLATDQSIWSTGDQFTFVDNRFIGVNTGNFDYDIGSTFYAGIDGHIKLGFQSTLEFEGGEIDAVADYDVTVDTNFNKTTDQLLIDTSKLLTGGTMHTEGPEGSYSLAFVYDVFLHAFAGVDIDLDPFGHVGGQVDVTIPQIGPGSLTLIDLPSDELTGTIELPPPIDFLSLNFDWPEIVTDGSYPPHPVTSDGSSDNFFELVLDVDQLVADIVLGGVNPFDPPALTAGPFFADLDILDVDVYGGLNFLQEFEMTLGDLTGILTFEDGLTETFTIGGSYLLNNASDHDADEDGLVEFNFAVVPTASLHNNTDLGFNIGFGIEVLKLELGYDIEVASDSTTLGPLAQIGGQLPVGEVNVFDSTFDLAFDTNVPTDLYFYA